MCVDVRVKNEDIVKWWVGECSNGDLDAMVCERNEKIALFPLRGKKKKRMWDKMWKEKSGQLECFWFRE